VATVSVDLALVSNLLGPAPSLLLSGPRPLWHPTMGTYPNMLYHLIACIHCAAAGLTAVCSCSQAVQVVNAWFVYNNSS
jgi:hypothetical protein